MTSARQFDDLEPGLLMVVPIFSDIAKRAGCRDLAERQMGELMAEQFPGKAFRIEERAGRDGAINSFMVALADAS